jgi:Uma2 family endonuclease
MDTPGIRYVRPLRPLAFEPSDPEWDMPEAYRHHLLCELIHRVLREAAGIGASIGCDQFVFFDASDPTRKCAPDAFVKRGVPQTLFDSWKTWECGVPELAVEILSGDAEEKLTLDEKLARFHVMGIDEVVSFNADAPLGRRVRAWDLVSGDLIERVVEADATPCRTLGGWFVTVPYEADGLPAALRLAADARGERLVLTPAERERAEKERALAQVEELRAALAPARPPTNA